LGAAGVGKEPNSVEIFFHVVPINAKRLFMDEAACGFFYLLLSESITIILAPLRNIMEIVCHIVVRSDTSEIHEMVLSTSLVLVSKTNNNKVLAKCERP
jgi:hypothetical protein